MKDITYYLETWHLSNPELLFETETSHIYKVTLNEEAFILKLLNTIGIKDEANGALALQYFEGRSAVNIINFDDSAHLLEYADGNNLKILVQQDRDEEATKIIGRTINNLHEISSKEIPKGLTTLEERFQALFKKTTTVNERTNASIYFRAALIAKKLLSSQKNLKVLHGDIHHENILHSEKRGWLAIDPKGLYGENTYDAANALCNPRDIENVLLNEVRLLKNAKILADYLKVDILRLISFAFSHAVLSACWSLEDDRDPSMALKIAAMIEPHINY